MFGPGNRGYEDLTRIAIRATMMPIAAAPMERVVMMRAPLVNSKRSGGRSLIFGSYPRGRCSKRPSHLRPDLPFGLAAPAFGIGHSGRSPPYKHATVKAGIM